ncbi:MAG: cytochrome c oxidase subunit II [Deltaproteobacteria bacterium]|nr:cytochrome c oxidase subunit II [Deltaproteobacteria bacterium]
MWLWRGVWWSGGRRRSRLAGTALGVVLLAAAAHAQPAPIPSIFDPLSRPADEIYTLSLFVLGICAVIFVVVGGLLVTSIVRFRRRPDDDGREPPQVYGSNPIELAWTVVPLLIVFVLFLVTTRSIIAIERAAPPADALEVRVIGHQWWWEFRYPAQGVVTANELHVPAGRATFLTLESADVVHSFWVPQLNGKTDVIPNRVNRMWIEPRDAGLYIGQCAEYCGTQHARMLLRVVAHAPADFDAWVASQRGEAVHDPSVQAGRDLFQSVACINCHRIGGTVADGVFGPDLTHLMSRATIAAGAADNTAANLHAWIANPDALKPGALMPAMKLSDAQITQVVAYLTTLQ